MSLLALFVTLMHPASWVLGLVVAIAAVQLFKFSGAATIAKWLLAIAFALGPVLFGTTVAYPGYGSTLQYGGTSGGSYTTLGQLKKFAFNGLKADFDEITNLNSPTIYKEWLKTTVDGSDVTFDGVLNPTDTITQTLLTNIGTAGSTALDYWKITTTDGTTFTFQAYVSEFKTQVEYNKAITFSGSLKIVGAVTAVWS
jgi:predicted secreted protein